MIESACDLGTAVPIPMPWGGAPNDERAEDTKDVPASGTRPNVAPGDAAAPQTCRCRLQLPPVPSPPLAGVPGCMESGPGTYSYSCPYGQTPITQAAGGRRLDDLNPGVDRKTMARRPMPWAKHRIERLQKIRSTKGLDDRTECRCGGAAGPHYRKPMQAPASAGTFHNAEATTLPF